MPILPLELGVARHTIGAGQPGQFVGTLPQFIGQGVRRKPVFLSPLQRSLAPQRRQRKCQEADDRSDRRQFQSLHRVHGMNPSGKSSSHREGMTRRGKNDGLAPVVSG